MLFLDILIWVGNFGNVDKIRVLMIRFCEDVEEVRFVLEILIRLNYDDVEFRFRLNFRCYNLLLMVLCRFMLIDDMNCVYNMMLKDRFLFNIYIFNMMINGFCKLGDVV